MAKGKTPAVDVQSLETPSTLIATDRVFGGTQEINHDLFKLEVSTMRRNISYTDSPRYENIEHVHMYHSVDSRGNKMNQSAQVGGHYHIVTVTYEDGVGFKAVCSKPMKTVSKRDNGRNRKVSVELDDDDHIHTVEYRGSTKFKPSAINPEFAKLQSVLVAREAGVPGVIES